MRSFVFIALGFGFCLGMAWHNLSLLGYVEEGVYVLTSGFTAGVTFACLVIVGDSVRRERRFNRWNGKS